MTQCQHCGAANKPGARFCFNCGKPLAGGMQTISLGGMAQGRYQVQRLLGQGGMGAVYQVLDTRLGGKPLAMKEMSDAALTDPAEKAAAITAFKHEAELLAKLDHPNIPKVSDSFTEGGKHYIVMELVPGETLEERLARQGRPCSEAEVRDWARQVCEVLAFLHGQTPPVIFRDLKPGNIMITPQGQVKLIDFGIARFFKTGKTGDTTQMGTKGYAPPEQYSSTQQTDGRSDIYSLGVVLHTALTYYDPATTPMALPPVRQLNPTVSVGMEQIVTRATQVNMSQRYPNAGEFLQALGGGQPPPIAPPILPPQVVQPPVQPSPRPRVPALAVLVVVVLLLGGGGALAYQMLTSPTPVPFIPTPPRDEPTPPVVTETVQSDPTEVPPAVETETPVATGEPPATQPEPTDPPAKTPTSDWRIEADRAVRDVVNLYGDLKVDSLTYLVPDRLPEVLAGALLERQRRGICGMKKAGQYYTYANRSFDVLEVGFDDRTHARVLAYIEEDRVLYDRNGSVRKDYGHEFYRAIYRLQKQSDDRWYITCFEALPDGNLPDFRNISCNVTVPAENPCIE